MCTVQRNMSKTCPSKRHDGRVAEVTTVIRDNMVIRCKSIAQHSESVSVRRAEFDTKTSEASHVLLERMPNLVTMDALAILGRELVENNTLKKCFVGRWVETMCVCKHTVSSSAAVAFTTKKLQFLACAASLRT